MANEFRIKNGLITPAVLSEETDGKIVLTRLDADTGDDKGVILAFESKEVDIALDDVLGKITFAAPDETSASGDNKLVAGAIAVISEGDFSNTNNASKMVFQTGASETATTKMTISSSGVVTLANNLNVGGATTLDGAVTLGNATGDDITFTGRLSGDFVPKTDLASDLGTATLGFNTLHIGSGGIINFEAGDISLTHSSNTLTMTGGAFAAPTLRYTTSFLSDKELSGSGSGLLIGANAHASFQVRTSSVLLEHDDVDLTSQSSLTHAPTLALNQKNTKLSVIVTDDTSVGDEELFPLAYFNVSNNSQTIYHSLEITGQVKVNYDSDHSTSSLQNDPHVDYNETMRARYSAFKNTVEFQSINSVWAQNIQAQGPPGEFCAQHLTDDAGNRWLVVSYVNYKSYTSEFTTTITAHINALQNPVISQG